MMCMQYQVCTLSLSFSYLNLTNYSTVSEGTTPPSLLVTVCGTVIHGKGPNPTAPPSKTVDEQPRIFTQTFVLTPDPDAAASESSGSSVVYYVNADSLRFVG